MKSNTFALSGAAFGPIRQALYSALSPCLEEMNATFERTNLEESRATHTAYRRLIAVGGLLDKVGWTKHAAKRTLTISTPDQATLLMDVLGDELENEEGRAANADPASEARYVSACEARIRALRETLSTVAVEAMAAGLLKKDAGDA